MKSQKYNLGKPFKKTTLGVPKLMYEELIKIGRKTNLSLPRVIILLIEEALVRR